MHARTHALTYTHALEVVPAQSLIPDTKLLKVYFAVAVQSMCIEAENMGPYLKGELSPILLSEMSLPGVEVLIEKLLPKILGRLGKENL